MKFIAVLLALVACSVAAPAPPSEQAPSAFNYDEFEAALRQNNVLPESIKEVMEKLHEIAESPATPIAPNAAAAPPVVPPANIPDLKIEEITTNSPVADNLDSSEKPSVEIPKTASEKTNPDVSPEPVDPLNTDSQSHKVVIPSTDRKSMITLIKENPINSAIGAAIVAASLASIYALIKNRRRFAMNTTSTANSTAVPSPISAPINATSL